MRGCQSQEDSPASTLREAEERQGPALQTRDVPRPQFVQHPLPSNVRVATRVSQLQQTIINPSEDNS